MGGLCGFVRSSKNWDHAKLTHIIGAMTDQLTHRGPDSGAVWVDESLNLTMGHRRLATLDISQNAMQPVFSLSGRYGVIFDGFIDHFLKWRTYLEQQQYTLRNHSDTEIMVGLLDHFGIEQTLARLQGMFAVAIIDRVAQKLYLVRDKAGRKPLYYGAFLDNILFASELKALKAYPGFYPDICPIGLTCYIEYGYIRAPQSIFKDVYKLQAGNYLEIDLTKPLATQALPRRCKKIAFIPSVHRDEQPRNQPFTDKVQNIIRDYRITDRPFSCQLSMDQPSILMAALAQKLQPTPLPSFSVHFEGAPQDNRQQIQKIADYIGLDHHQYDVSRQDCLDIVPFLSHVFDEPHDDPLMIPMLHQAIIAKQSWDVVLSAFIPRENYVQKPIYPWSSSWVHYLYDHTYLKFQRRWLDQQTSPQRLLKQTQSMTNRADRSPIHMTTLDRVSMANGLEMRAIFFNDQIMRRSEIRQAVEKMIPKYIPTPLLKSCHEMVEPDISGWLRDPLKNWGGDFLHADQLQQQGFLNPARIQRLWDQHQSGKRDWSEILWRIIIFQNWLYVWR